MTRTPRNQVIIISLVLAAFVIASAVFLFLPQSLRLDESQTLWQINRFPSGILHAVAGDVHVPLYHFIAYFWESVFGNGVTANRVLSLIFYIACIPLIIIFGDEVYKSREVSIFAAVIFAISPFMNWYGNEIRMYTLLVLATIVNQYFFVRARRDNKKSSWIGYGISAVVGMYVHYFFSLVLLTQALFYFAYRKAFPDGSFKKLTIVAVAVAAALSPWLIYVLRLGQIVNSEPLLPAPTLIDIFNTFSEFLFGNQSNAINSFIVALWPLIMLAWFFALQKDKKNRTVENDYMFFSVVIPIVVTFIVSVVYKPIYLERYLIFALPAFYLLLSATIMAYSTRISRILQVGFLVAMLCTLYVQAMNPMTPTKENFETAVNYFNEYATPQDVIVLSAPFTIYPVEYYYSGPTAIYTLPLWDQNAKGAMPAFDLQTLPAQVQDIAGDHDRVWLLLSYDQGYQSDIKSYFDDHYRQLGDYELSPGMSLILYQLRYDVPDTAPVPESVALQ